MNGRHRDEIYGGADGEDGRVVSCGRVEHQADGKRHDHPANPAGEAAEADYGAHRSLGEHVGRQRNDAPGLGVDIDEELAAKYEYKRAYLPVNRLEDGTLSDW